jgi:tetratricopeptide (TPR) repeat protein
VRIKTALPLVSLVVLLPSAAALADRPAPPPAGARPGATASATAPAAAAPGTVAAAIEAARKGAYADAEKQLLAIKGAEQPNALITLARLEYDQGKYADAEKYANQAGPSKRVEAAVLRAEMLFHGGKRDDAIKLLQANAKEKGPAGREVRVLLGEYLIKMGKRDDAEAPLMELIQEYNSDAITEADGPGMALVGRAAYLLRSYKDANKLFGDSERGTPNDVRRRLWQAEMYLEKYNIGQAEKFTKEALKLAPSDPAALIMLARVKLEQTLDFEAAEKIVTDTLAINPRYAPAFAIRAGIELRDADLDDAEKAIAEGLKNDPDDLELWSLKAAARFLADDPTGYAAAKKEALTRNPQYSNFFIIVGEYAEWEHRYDDIVTMMKEGTTVDPKDGKVWAQLGLTLMRNGDETAGRAALDQAWSKDKYNVRVYNTLELYDKAITPNYDLVTDGVFKIRYPKPEEDVLKRYLPTFLGEAWASMKARYGYVPSVPIQVELYGDVQARGWEKGRQQFSVRTSGLPNIGIQGVCFGRVVAAMSPASEPFNWGNVVWHELGHVFAIQISKNHVPRWFTEGLSEYETIARRPEWSRELDPELYTAIAKNRLPNAVDMNRAFTHATNAEDVTVAYYAASQMLVFSVATYGMNKVVDALKLWGAGKRTPEVIQGAFGLSAADYDKAFRAWAMNRLERYKGQFIPDEREPKDLDDALDAVKKKPNDVDAHVDLVASYVDEGKKNEALAELDAALKLDPKNPRANFWSFRVGKALDDKQRIERALANIQASGDGFWVRMQLAALAKGKKDKAGMTQQLEAAYRFDPTQPEPLKYLAMLAADEKRDADTLALLRRFTLLEQHDQDMWTLFLGMLVEQKQWAEAVKVGESAIYVDVHSSDVHQLYGKALLEMKDYPRAQFELESALLCKPAQKDAASIHAMLAKALLAQGKTAEAKPHVDEAKKLDPKSEELKGL